MVETLAMAKLSNSYTKYVMLHEYGPSGWLVNHSNDD